MDIVSKEVRSRIMAQVKSSNNKTTEKAFIQILKKHSIKGWRRHYSIFGKPDFVFSSMRVAIFIDGCFWHHCRKHCRFPSSNTSYWQKKLANNKKRDSLVNNELKKRGWLVIRFWEHDINDKKTCSRKIAILKKAICSSV